MSDPDAVTPSGAQSPQFKVGQLVWVQFSKKVPWPSRIAAITEVSEAIKAEKRGAQDFLVFYFGSQNYSWARPNQISAWEFDATALEEAKKKNKAKSYAQGLEEAHQWFEGPKILPLATPEPAKSESKPKSKSEDKKRMSKEGDMDAPPAKRPKKASSVDDDNSSESETDSPYKFPFPDAKKAPRVRTMRKLGLYPPEGSLFKPATH